MVKRNDEKASMQGTEIRGAQRSAQRLVSVAASLIEPET
jgi:hypothetical protein